MIYDGKPVDVNAQPAWVRIPLKFMVFVSTVAPWAMALGLLVTVIRLTVAH